MLNLQLFTGAAVQGRKLVYLFRVQSQAASESGYLLSYTTENSRKMTNDADTVATKDGTVRVPGTPEVEITATTLLAADDTHIDAIEAASKDGALVECWEANLDMPGTGDNKFKGTYYQGYITSFEKSSQADGNVEISITFGANGAGATGDVTVTAAQQEQASYVFTDTPATGA